MLFGAIASEKAVIEEEEEEPRGYLIFWKYRIGLDRLEGVLDYQVPRYLL